MNEYFFVLWAIESRNKINCCRIEPNSMAIYVTTYLSFYSVGQLFFTILVCVHVTFASWLERENLKPFFLNNIQIKLARLMIAFVYNFTTPIKYALSWNRLMAITHFDYTIQQPKQMQIVYNSMYAPNTTEKIYFYG